MRPFYNFMLKVAGELTTNSPGSPGNSAALAPHG